MTDRTDPEYYADSCARLRRILDRLDVRHPHNRPTMTHPYPLKFDLPHDLQIVAWYYESLLTALECPDRKVALRALCQAYGYAEKFPTKAYVMGCDRDYLIECRNRLEACLEVAS